MRRDEPLGVIDDGIARAYLRIRRFKIRTTRDVRGAETHASVVAVEKVDWMVLDTDCEREHGRVADRSARIPRRGEHRVGRKVRPRRVERVRRC